MTSAPPPPPSGGEEIDHRAAAEAFRTRSATFVDVREPDEWAAGHIPRARHIPLGELAHRYLEVPRDQPVVMVCHVGGRSYQATAFLRELGYDQVVNFDGGMAAWAEAGHPIER